jgi:siroheme synthase
MIRAARRGRRVVRLKGGDPFVFGRGGEEALALLKAGVPFDVVPGVTSAIAAPELAGIPVTLRGVSSAILVVSGHDEAAFGAAVGSVPPDTVTLVVLMGTANAPALGRILTDRGWGPQTPAAVIANASTVEQRVWRTTIGELSAMPAIGRVDGPATIVIGNVVASAVAGEQAPAARERKYVTRT